MWRLPADRVQLVRARQQAGAEPCGLFLRAAGEGAQLPARSKMGDATTWLFPVSGSSMKARPPGPNAAPRHDGPDHSRRLIALIRLSRPATPLVSLPTLSG